MLTPTRKNIYAEVREIRRLLFFFELIPITHPKIQLRGIDFFGKIIYNLNYNRYRLKKNID